MLRSTLSTGFLHEPQSGGNPGPAANSAKPDGDGHRVCPMTHGEYGLPPPSGGEPVLVIGGPGTGRADRDRSTGQRLEPTTGEPTLAIGRQGNGNDHDSRPYRRDMISAASVDWRLADAA